MKYIINISGILGATLILMRITGIFSEYGNQGILLISGIILLTLVFIPLSIFDRYRYNKRMDEIINAYKQKKEDSTKITGEKTRTKGWGMNNSPYRQRKSGLNWGAGNIKAANAVRGKRKSFLK